VADSRIGRSRNHGFQLSGDGFSLYVELIVHPYLTGKSKPLWLLYRTLSLSVLQ
jgi:hypothetical protein